ncbi:hypothetical protein BGZ93_001239, partial [Podila epicladia]
MSDNNNNLKEEIIELEKPVASPSTPDSSHIVNIDQDVGTSSLSSPVDPSEEKGKKKQSRWGKKKSDKKGEDGGKEEEKAEPVAKVSYFQLYRFASTWDWFCVV